MYEKWSEEYFPTLSNASSIRTITAAYKYCTPLYDMRIKDVRVEHLEGTIHSANVGSSTKGRMKSLFNLMYKWAMKHELVDKNYAALCDGVKRERPTIVRIPFSEQEIAALMEHPEIPFADMIAIRNCSGWRPQELAALKVADVDMDNMTYTGGLKTDPAVTAWFQFIHWLLIWCVRIIEQAVGMGSNYLFNDPDGRRALTLHMTNIVDVSRRLWHDWEWITSPRHQTHFYYESKRSRKGMNEYILKMIVGRMKLQISQKRYILTVLWKI